MPVLQALTDAIRDGSVEVIDLTSPLSASTPIIQLPPPIRPACRSTTEAPIEKPTAAIRW